MAKRKRYDDKFRASAVVMLEAAGYPGKLGALATTAKHIGVPERTLSRWFNGEQNEPPTDMVVTMKDSLPENLISFLEANKSTRFDWTENVPRGKLDTQERYVYLIRESWRGMVKIGIATDLYARVASMQAGCPQDLKVIGYFMTAHAKAFESHLHQRFSHKLYSGEWFELNDDDIRLILDYHEGFVAVDYQWQKRQDTAMNLEQMRFC